MLVRHAVVAIMLAVADGAGDPTAVKNEGGKYYDKEGNPNASWEQHGR
jgi:hypothetical protein